MKQTECLDYAENLIKIKRLVIEVERLVNDRQFIQALEEATELCVEAREMKSRMYNMLPPPHIVKD